MSIELAIKDQDRIKEGEEETIGGELWFPEVLITGIVNGSGGM